MLNLQEMNEYFIIQNNHLNVSSYQKNPINIICTDPLPWCSLPLLTFSLWLDGVLPLVMDRESTAQEKCFQILEEVILSSIVPYSKLVAQLTVRTLRPFIYFCPFLVTTE